MLGNEEKENKKNFSQFDRTHIDRTRPNSPVDCLLCHERQSRRSQLFVLSQKEKTQKRERREHWNIFFPFSFQWMEIFIFIVLHTFIDVSTREIAKCTYVMFLSNIKCSAQKWNKNENTRVRPRNSSPKWKHQMENFVLTELQFRSFCTRLLSWGEFKGIWNLLRAIFTFMEEDECAFILQQSLILCSYVRNRTRFARLKIYDSFFQMKAKNVIHSSTHSCRCSRHLKLETLYDMRKKY